jgi:hypothetical protein
MITLGSIWQGQPMAKLRAAAARGASFLTVGAVLAFFPATIGFATWHEVRALQRQWAIAGPPCPDHGDRPIPPQWGHLNKGFDYGQARWDFGRALTYCADIPKPGLLAMGTYQVCQFNNPNVVRVETSRGIQIFGPLRSQRVTVTVRDGVASCVVGGWFDTSKEEPGA